MFASDFALAPELGSGLRFEFELESKPPQLMSVSARLQQQAFLSALPQQELLLRGLPLRVLLSRELLPPLAALPQLLAVPLLPPAALPQLLAVLLPPLVGLLRALPQRALQFHQRRQRLTETAQARMKPSRATV